jgi:rhodanese-related sulfurtransferase
MKFLDKLFGARIDGTQARRLVDEGAFLLDVRTAGEFAGGHLPGAVNIPVDLLADGMRQLPDPNRVIVVYCRSGMRSSRAAGLLRRAGFQTVHDLGGMGNW